MRKTLATRIIVLTISYCVVFCVLVLVQFSSKGNFTLSAGAMTVRGRYFQERLVSPVQNLDAEEPRAAQENAKTVAGGIKINYGGIEFSLKEERSKGLRLSGADRSIFVNPEYMTVNDNRVDLILPGGTALSFTSIESSRGIELQINAEFTEDFNEISIPIILRRSSLVRDNGQLGVVHGGHRYVFSSLGEELENGVLILTDEDSFISYKSRGRQRAFDPADYVIARAHDYDNAMDNWQNSFYTRWSQNRPNNEEDIIAFLSLSMERSNFAAASFIPLDFVNSPRHSYRSSVFLGGMTNAYNTFLAAENESMSRIILLIRERSLDILNEENIIEYLYTRNNAALINDAADIISGMTVESVMYEQCPGILEFLYDISRRQPGREERAEHLIEQVLLLISENLHHNGTNDSLYAAPEENIDFNIRLGKALAAWGESTEHTDWAMIGKSLKISAAANAVNGRQYNALNFAEYRPRALRLSDTGHWAWTLSPSINMAEAGGYITLTFSYPVNMSHYVIIRGIRQFTRIQFYGMDWRSDREFERYDSSGFVYYPRDQILILKLQHREFIENVRIIYVEPPRPQPLPPPQPVINIETVPSGEEPFANE